MVKRPRIRAAAPLDVPPSRRISQSKVTSKAKGKARAASPASVESGEDGEDEIQFQTLFLGNEEDSISHKIVSDLFARFYKDHLPNSLKKEVGSAIFSLLAKFDTRNDFVAGPSGHLRFPESMGKHQVC